jgi:acyl transferase domain-containing protein
MSKKPIVFMFSGQGAQFYQMGKELYETHSMFRVSMNQCNRIASDLLGRDLLSVIFDPISSKQDPFDHLIDTHPANVMIGYALAEALKSEGIRPDYVLGYSLGEMTAAAVAGAFSLEDVFRVVIESAKIFVETTPEAGMMAVVSPVSVFEEKDDLFSDTWLGCANFDRHFVVSGKIDRLRLIEEGLAAANIVCQILPVKRGFHSPLVAQAELPCKALYGNIRPLRIPLVSCMSKRKENVLSADHFWNSVRRLVRFDVAIREFCKQQDFCLVDVGPAGTLANFAKYALPQGNGCEMITTMNAFGRDKATFEKAVAACRANRV